MDANAAGGRSSGEQGKLPFAGDVAISGGVSAAHYVSDYADVAGIRLPTTHRIFPRTPDGQSLAEPLIVSIDLSEIAFT